MKGVLVEKAGGEYTLVDTVEKPKPGKGQILVKSLVSGLNPVEEFLRAGILVTAWPIVVGCDASGIVVEVGDGVTKFEEGDKVYGCTRLGVPGYATFQEYFLMDENLTFKNYGNLSTEEAATVGVGVLTAALALISGLKIELTEKKCDESSEWVVVMGAAGAVGQFGVQLAKLCGYKVLASCSPANDKVVKALGADATFSYKLPPDEQLSEIKRITGGKFSRVFDGSALAAEAGMEALAKHGDSDAKVKYFATTNDWAPIEKKEGIEIYLCELGLIGRDRDNALIKEVNDDMISYIPKLEQYFKSGALKPMAWEQAVGVGIEAVPEGLEAFKTRKSDGKKIVVRLAAD